MKELLLWWLHVVGVLRDPPEVPGMWRWAAVTYVGSLSWRGEMMVLREEASDESEWRGNLRLPKALRTQNPEDHPFDWGARVAKAELLAVALLADAAGIEAARNRALVDRVLDVVAAFPRVVPTEPPPVISGETTEQGWRESWRLSREEVLRIAGLLPAVAAKRLAPLTAAADREAAWALIARLEGLTPDGLRHVQRFARAVKGGPS